MQNTPIIARFLVTPLLAAFALLAAPGCAPAEPGTDAEELGSQSQPLGVRQSAWLTFRGNQISYTSTYNNGQPISLTRWGLGDNIFDFAGLAVDNQFDGNVQVSGGDGAGGHCKAVDWGLTPGVANSLRVRVRCFDLWGNPTVGFFSLHYRHEISTSGAEGSYLMAHQPTAPGPYVPARSWTSMPSGSHSVTRTTPGDYKVSLLSQGLALGGLQVTALGDNNSYCKIGSLAGSTPFGQATVRVLCFSPSGTPTDASFSLDYHNTPPSPHGVGYFAISDSLQGTFTPAHQYVVDEGCHNPSLTFNTVAEGVYRATSYINGDDSAILVTAYGENPSRCWATLTDLWYASEVTVYCSRTGATQRSLFSATLVSRVGNCR